MHKKRIDINETISLSKKMFGKDTWQLTKDEKLQFAIKNCRRIRITYDDKKGGKGKNTRYILPLVYGITNNGKKAIRAFQTYGSTKRGYPKYKLFLVNNIKQIDIGKIKYYDYEQTLLNTGFNTFGDKSFSNIYAITPLAKNFSSASLSNPDVPINSKPVKKSEIDKSEEETPKVKTDFGKTQKTSTTPAKTIDKSANKDYFLNKIEAPDTEPVSKREIETGEKSAKRPDVAQPSIENGDETPENTDNDNDIKVNNILSKSYKDMMDRIDNLYNDEDEENEDNI